MSDVLCVFDVFFFKQKTAYEMRISDWSSDVCSSDLFEGDEVPEALAAPTLAPGDTGYARYTSGYFRGARPGLVLRPKTPAEVQDAVDRKSVVAGKSVSVRVDPGGRRIIKKKNM